ncbi:MAG: DUF1345 domain-containing protein [Niabella sp.]
MTGKAKEDNRIFFQRLQPIHRSLIGLAAALVTFVVLPSAFTMLIKLLFSWIVFSLVYLICCWWVILTMPVAEIQKIADKEDGSKVFVFTIILLASIASFLCVFFIIISDKAQHLSQLGELAITICGMLFSWFLVHTAFVFHYAHLFYNSKTATPLDFPGDEDPDYLDFAYFSFVMGCTFQVSDVAITSKKLRRIALFHGLLSFALNTFVIALTINIISGLLH